MYYELALEIDQEVKKRKRRRASVSESQSAGDISEAVQGRCLEPSFSILERNVLYTFLFSPGSGSL